MNIACGEKTVVSSPPLCYVCLLCLFMKCCRALSSPSLMLMYSQILIALMSLCLSVRTNMRKKWGRTRRWRRKPVGRWLKLGRRRKWEKERGRKRKSRTERFFELRKTKQCRKGAKNSKATLNKSMLYQFWTSCTKFSPLYWCWNSKRNRALFIYGGKWVGGWGRWWKSIQWKFFKGATVIVCWEWKPNGGTKK